MVDKLPNLVGPLRNDALVTALLAIFLLKHNARDTTVFARLGRNVLAGGAERNGAYFRVFGIRSGQTFEVCKRWWFDEVLENGDGRELTEMAEMEGVCKDLTTAMDQHLVKTLCRDRGRRKGLKEGF